MFVGMVEVKCIVCIKLKVKKSTLKVNILITDQGEGIFIYKNLFS
jgi:hypothetical protein